MNSFNGYADGTFVYRVGNDPVGFISYMINNIDATTSTIVLNAVSDLYSNKGIYQSMMKSVSQLILKHSKKIRIGTQVDNLAVQRTLQKIDYRLVDVKYVLHY